LYEREEGLDLINDVVKTVETFDITTIRSSIPLYILAKKIATETDITVLFNGDGADECQMGYLYFYLAKHYWLPSWAGTNEPSARILSVYSTSEN
jgi:asparagine synthase (glutamine-hydrolysing)